jgi:PAS domain S-box-containing protein
LKTEEKIDSAERKMNNKTQKTETDSGVQRSEAALIQDRIQYLRDSTDFVSTLFESLVGYAIIAADFDGNIIAYNEGAHQIYGYAPGEVIGRKAIEIFFPKEFIEEGKLEHITKELIGAGRFSYEGEKIKKDNSRFPALMLFTLTRDKNGQVVGFIEIVQDLTEQKQAQETVRQLQMKQLQLQQLEQERAEAVRNYQHYLAISQKGPDESDALPRPDEAMLNEFFRDYRDTVLRYVRAVRIRQDRPSESVRGLARRLSDIRARAQDVVRLHLRVLHEFSQRAMPDEDRSFSNDARLVLVELMGNLMDIYLSIPEQRISRKGPNI